MKSHRKDARKAAVAGFFLAGIIRVVGWTLRIRVDDRAGVSTRPPDGQLIWVFWHNRIFVLPFLYRRFLRSRRGAVLTSASGDGEIIARTVRRFGVEAVRGSSSRRRVGALVGLVDWVRRGFDVAVTPDGPRGPRHRFQPGPVKLAQLTGARIFPIHVRYGRAWTFRTWDRFAVPLPFSRVDVVFDAPIEVDPGLEGEAFEAERGRIERLLLAETDEGDREAGA